MKKGNLKRAVKQQSFTLEDGLSVMKVLSPRGSILIEVMDEKGEKSLVLLLAKFSKSLWIKRGGKDKVLESGSKVARIVSQVLFYEQVRVLK